MSVSTVAEYLASLPEDRRAVVNAVRKVVNENLPKGYEEGLQHGMVGWYVPKSVYPAGYHTNPKLPLGFMNLASQKSYFALYMTCVYGDAKLRDWFVGEYEKSGKKLDMGKGCLRFKTLDDVPLDVIGKTVARVPVKAYIEGYEAALAKRATAKKPTKTAKVAKPATTTRTATSAKRPKKAAARRAS